MGSEMCIRDSLRPQHKFKNTTLGEEVMADPIPWPWFVIPLGTLDIDGPVTRIEIDVADSGDLSSKGISNADFFEVRWSDQVNVLTGHWPQTHHAQNNK